MEEILTAEKGDLSRICKLFNVVSNYRNFEVRTNFFMKSLLVVLAIL